MRTKAEIIKAIAKTRQERDSFVYHDPIYDELAKAKILSLQWVLGYKMPQYYYCLRCQYLHKHLECPRCKNHEIGRREPCLKGLANTWRITNEV